MLGYGTVESEVPLVLGLCRAAEAPDASIAEALWDGLARALGAPKKVRRASRQDSATGHRIGGPWDQKSPLGMGSS